MGEFRGVWVLGCVLGLVGCSSKTCTEEGVAPSVRVTVVDAKSGQPLCDGSKVQVTVQGGATNFDAKDCEWVGLYTPPATIAVTGTGYRAVSKTVNDAIQEDDCDKPIAVSVRIEVGSAADAGTRD